MSHIVENRAILVSIAERGSDLAECNVSLDELERLLNTAGGECFCKVIQVKESFDPRTCIGKGKVEEISSLCRDNDIKLVVFDFELTPAQIRNLENDIGDVTVIDRSMLILDIFALHAVSAEGKIQVELAQLKYSAPRLTGKGLQLSRQGGGIGSRGPGESKLETDKRHLHERVVALERKIEELERNRSVMRAARDRSGIAKVALVGYTNAGKSTLLNALTGADVLCQDKLFATLDPTTRQMDLPSGKRVLFTDTVGFIRKLPHHIVKAFKSTLDEVRYADILLVVADASDPEVSLQLDVTRDIIKDLGASDKPIVYVYNKCDKLEGGDIGRINSDSIAISAALGEGIDALLGAVDDIVNAGTKRVRLVIPYTEQSVVNQIYNVYPIESTDYVEEGVSVITVLDKKGLGQLKKYISEELI